MQHCRNFIRIAARIPPFQRFGVRSLWDARTGLPVSGTNLSGGGARSLVVEASDQDSPLSSTDMFGDELPSEKQVFQHRAIWRAHTYPTLLPSNVTTYQRSHMRRRWRIG